MKLLDKAFTYSDCNVTPLTIWTCLQDPKNQVPIPVQLSLLEHFGSSLRDPSFTNSLTTFPHTDSLCHREIRGGAKVFPALARAVVDAKPVSHATFKIALTRGFSDWILQLDIQDSPHYSSFQPETPTSSFAQAMALNVLLNPSVIPHQSVWPALYKANIITSANFTDIMDKMLTHAKPMDWFTHPNQYGDGESVLHAAVANDDVAMVGVILEYIKKNYPTAYNATHTRFKGQTPIDLAVQLGYVSIVKLLAASGAACDIKMFTLLMDAGEAAFLLLLLSGKSIVMSGTGTAKGFDHEGLSYAGCGISLEDMMPLFYYDRIIETCELLERFGDKRNKHGSCIDNYPRDAFKACLDKLNKEDFLAEMATIRPRDANREFKGRKYPNLARAVVEHTDDENMKTRVAGMYDLRDGKGRSKMMSKMGASSMGCSYQ
jgi:hypothetical protein